MGILPSWDLTSPRVVDNSTSRLCPTGGEVPFVHNPTQARRQNHVGTQPKPTHSKLGSSRDAPAGSLLAIGQCQFFKVPHLHRGEPHPVGATPRPNPAWVTTTATSQPRTTITRRVIPAQVRISRLSSRLPLPTL